MPLSEIKPLRLQKILNTGQWAAQRTEIYYRKEDTKQRGAKSSIYFYPSVQAKDTNILSNEMRLFKAEPKAFAHSNARKLGDIF